VRVYPDIWSTPFGKSPRTDFVGTMVAPLSAGQYTFSGVSTPFLIPVPLVPQSVYWFLDWNFSVDVAAADYTAAIAQTPLVSVYESARPNMPIFRQPFPVPVYYENKWLLQGFRNNIAPNQLLFAIEGVVNQTAALIGKASLTATVQFTAYEVTDPAYIERFTVGLDVPPPARPTPAGPQPGGPMDELAKKAALNPTFRVQGGIELPN
jgi:hypothetical protein